MKNKHKITAMFLSILLCSNLVIPPMQILATGKNKESSIEMSSQKRIDKIAEQHIHYDEKMASFVVDVDTLKGKLSQDQIDRVLKEVEDTNFRIKSAIEKTNSEIAISVVDTNDNKIVIKESAIRGRGKNAIEYHWNYARIFIDAGNVSLALQVGFAIGSVYAPAKIIQAVCAAFGIVSGNVKHGIWFDYNYFIGILCGNFGLQ